MVLERVVDTKRRRGCWKVSKMSWGRAEARPRSRMSMTRGCTSESTAGMQPRSRQPRRIGDDGGGGGCWPLRKGDEEEWSLG